MSKPVAIVKIVDEETGEVLRDSTMVPLYLTNPYDNFDRFEPNCGAKIESEEE